MSYTTKPWLLMDPEERQARTDDYASLCADSLRHPPSSEMLLAMFKPPSNREAALLELFLHQSRPRGTAPEPEKISGENSAHE